MNVRVRTWVGLGVTGVAATAFARISEDPSLVETYAFVAVWVPIYLVWVALAPDGDLRRDPRRR
jgi:hypothetical protein